MKTYCGLCRTDGVTDKTTDERGTVPCPNCGFPHAVAVVDLQDYADAPTHYHKHRQCDRCSSTRQYATPNSKQRMWHHSADGRLAVCAACGLAAPMQ